MTNVAKSRLIYNHHGSTANNQQILLSLPLPWIHQYNTTVLSSTASNYSQKKQPIMVPHGASCVTLPSPTSYTSRRSASGPLRKQRLPRREKGLRSEERRVGKE